MRRSKSQRRTSRFSQNYSFGYAVFWGRWSFSTELTEGSQKIIGFQLKWRRTINFREVVFGGSIFSWNFQTKGKVFFGLFSLWLCWNSNYLLYLCQWKEKDICFWFPITFNNWEMANNLRDIIDYIVAIVSLLRQWRVSQCSAVDFEVSYETRWKA